MIKRRFTWLDGVLIAILAIVIAVGAFLVLRPSAAEEEDASLSSEVSEKEYLVTLRFNQITQIKNDGYKVGDKLYFQNRVATMGKIKSVKSFDRKIERFDTNSGEYVIMDEPGKKTVELTVLVEGKMEKGRFTVEDQELFIGRLFYPQTNTTRSAMTVWDIEEVTQK